MLFSKDDTFLSIILKLSTIYMLFSKDDTFLPIILKLII